MDDVWNDVTIMSEDRWVKSNTTTIWSIVLPYAAAIMMMMMMMMMIDRCA